MGTDEIVKGILSHHGIKGMRWGIRRDRPSAVTVSTKTTPVGTIIKTKGGEKLPAHPDAVAARVISQKLKKSGKNSLSNDEMQKLALRLNLEQQVSRLNETNKNASQKFITDVLGNVAKQQVTKIATDLAAKQVESLLTKKT